MLLIDENQKRRGNMKEITSNMKKKLGKQEKGLKIKYNNNPSPPPHREKYPYGEVSSGRHHGSVGCTM
jgi:hypothetical protein